MALTTLIGLLVISAAPNQEPIQVMIETKICRVAEGSLALEAQKIDIKPLTEKGNEVHILTNLNEAKLFKNIGLKVLSSPVIRTLDSMKAEVTVSVDRDTLETWRVAYLPVVRKDALIDLDIKLGVEVKDDESKSWNMSAKPKLHPGQSIGILVSKGKHALLYVIKAHVGDGSRSRSRHP